MFEEEFLEEEAANNPPPMSAILNVRGWLMVTFGAEIGNDIYEQLQHAAETSTSYRDMGGLPGIVFTDDGGEFVSLDDPSKG